MADVFTKEKRSEIMSKIRSNGNKSTELKMIALFKAYGIKYWKRHYKIKGKPDFVFPKNKVAIFVDGCFWHGHECSNLKPKSNIQYWESKIKKNKERDAQVSAYLEKRGWRVLRVWECELKRQKISDTASMIKKALSQAYAYIENK